MQSQLLVLFFMKAYLFAAVYERANQCLHELRGLDSTMPVNSSERRPQVGTKNEPVSKNDVKATFLLLYCFAFGRETPEDIISCMGIALCIVSRITYPLDDSSSLNQ